MDKMVLWKPTWMKQHVIALLHQTPGTRALRARDEGSPTTGSQRKPPRRRRKNVDAANTRPTVVVIRHHSLSKIDQAANKTRALNGLRCRRVSKAWLDAWYTKEQRRRRVRRHDMTKPKVILSLSATVARWVETTAAQQIAPQTIKAQPAFGYFKWFVSWTESRNTTHSSLGNKVFNIRTGG